MPLYIVLFASIPEEFLITVLGLKLFGVKALWGKDTSFDREDCRDCYTAGGHIVQCQIAAIAVWHSHHSADTIVRSAFILTSRSALSVFFGRYSNQRNSIYNFRRFNNSSFALLDRDTVGSGSDQYYFKIIVFYSSIHGNVFTGYYCFP